MADSAKAMRPVIPAWMDDAGLTPSEFRVLAHLWRRAGARGECYPAAASICAACGFKRDERLWPILRKLESDGYLKRNRWSRNRNNYVLVASPKGVASTPENPGDSVPPENRVTDDERYPENQGYSVPPKNRGTQDAVPPKNGVTEGVSTPENPGDSTPEKRGYSTPEKRGIKDIHLRNTIEGVYCSIDDRAPSLPLIDQQCEPTPPTATKRKPKATSAASQQVEAIYSAYPRKVGRKAALKAIAIAAREAGADRVLAQTRAYAAAVASWPAGERQFIPHPATWYRQGRYDDDPATWVRTPPARVANGAAVPPPPKQRDYTK